MPVLAALPLWAYVYQATLEPPPAGELDPARCAAARSTRRLRRLPRRRRRRRQRRPALDGVLETWPDYRDHMMWVRLGNGGWLEPSASRPTAPTTRRPAAAACPPHPALTDEELAQVVLYERVEFGGMEESGEEYEQLLADRRGRPDLRRGRARATQSEAVGRSPRTSSRRADRPIAGPVSPTGRLTP